MPFFVPFRIDSVSPERFSRRLFTVLHSFTNNFIRVKSRFVALSLHIEEGFIRVRIRPLANNNTS